MLDLIRNEKLLLQVQAAWNKGDFDAVASLTQSITNPDTKTAANVYVNDVNLYKGYIDQAQKMEASNPQEAIRQLTLAMNLNPNGPSNPAGKIADLQKAMQTKSAPPPPPPTLAAKPAVNSSADIRQKSEQAARRCAECGETGQSARCAQRLRNGPETSAGQPGCTEQY